MGCTQYASKLGKLFRGHSTGKSQLSFQWQRRAIQRMFKLPHNCTHLTYYQSNAQNSPSQASTIRDRWTSRYSSWIYKRQRSKRSNGQHPLDHRKSKRVPENYQFLLYWLLTSISALLTMPKPLTVWITVNCGKFWRRWEYQTTWPASWEICMQVRKQQLELDLEQQTGSK